MSSFIGSMSPLFASIINWVRSTAVLIRTNPFLLFTVGFVALGYAIAILGRMLSRE